MTELGSVVSKRPNEAMKAPVQLFWFEIQRVGRREDEWKFSVVEKIRWENFTWQTWGWSGQDDAPILLLISQGVDGKKNCAWSRAEKVRMHSRFPSFKQSVLLSYLKCSLVPSDNFPHSECFLWLLWLWHHDAQFKALRFEKNLQYVCVNDWTTSSSSLVTRL